MQKLSSFLSFISSPWTRGLCIGEAGNNCRLRHFYRPLEADFPPSGVTTRAPELVEFSSPLVVKVRKEVAKERREVIDLETGTRRSWVETREFDVVDLTGRISCIVVLFIPRLRGKICHSSSLFLFFSNLLSYQGQPSPPASVPPPPASRKPEVSDLSGTERVSFDLILEKLFLSFDHLILESPVSQPCLSCGKSFKGKKGLDAHRARTKNTQCRI